MPPKLTNPCSNQEVSYDLSSNARTSVRFRFQEEWRPQNPYEGWLDARARGLIEISPCLQSGSSIPRIRRSCPPLWSPPWPEEGDQHSRAARLRRQQTGRGLLYCATAGRDARPPPPPHGRINYLGPLREMGRGGWSFL
jgi:hypothetical protein